MSETQDHHEAPDTGARGDLLIAVVVYVIPLLAVSVFLVVVGLGGLAVALLAVEAVVAGLTLFVRRRPARPTGQPSTRVWLAPVAMVGVLAAIAGVAVLAAH